MSDRDRERHRDRDRDRDRDRRDRDRDRDRDRRSRRSRSRDRDRRRSSRSRSRDRGRRDSDRSRDPPRPAGPDMAQINAMAALQQQQLQQQLLQQQLLMQQQAAAAAAAPNLQANKKQREVYVGNLTIGVVNDVMLRELFNGALASLVPDPQTNPPVMNCQLDPTGRFAFVEMRSEELASSAMSLDKVDLCGRSINVGRPKGYIEPATGHVAPAQPFFGMQAAVAPGLPPGLPPAAAAAPVAVPAVPVPTCNLMLENLVPVKDVRDDGERDEITEDVKDECNQNGRVVVGITVPKPPDNIPDTDGGRVYVKFAEVDQAKSGFALMNGRTFDGNTVVAKYVTNEQFTLAQDGVWIDHSAPSAGGPVPPGPPALPGGAASLASLVPGGLPAPATGAAPAINPQLVEYAKQNPQLAALMGLQ